jgi:hypothetical protein
MHKHWAAAALLSLWALVLIGCAEEPATKVAYGEACNPENDGQRISTVGYFDPGVSVYCSDSGGDYRCGMDFLETPDSEDSFTADLLEGSGSNQMSKLPDSYSDADIKIQTNDGGVIGIGQKARITGKMLIGEGVCLMTVAKVEPAE